MSTSNNMESIPSKINNNKNIKHRTRLPLAKKIMSITTKLNTL